MGDGTARDDERTTHPLLDRYFPLSSTSVEDRVKAVLFHLMKSLGLEDEAFRRLCTEDLGTPEPVIDALVSGDIPALYKELARSGGWPVFASLLAYSDGLNADYATLRALQAEYEELDMDPRQRWLLPLSRSMMRERGYQPSGESFMDALTEAACDPRKVSNYEELIEALECLRISAGSLSLRDIAKNSQSVPKGADTNKHQVRSYNTINKVLTQVEGGPPLQATLAFVRGCGVQDLEELKAWEKACVRISIEIYKRGRGRSSTGPNPSMA